MKKNDKYIRWFDAIGIEDVFWVGGKNASLGEMCRELSAQGVKIPNGFAITAEAYRHVVNSAGILEELKTIMADLDKTDVADLAGRGREARHLILSAGIPDVSHLSEFKPGQILVTNTTTPDWEPVPEFSCGHWAPCFL